MNGTCADFCKCLAADFTYCLTGSLPSEPNVKGKYFVYRSDPTGRQVYYQFDREADSWSFALGFREDYEWKAVGAAMDPAAARKWVSSQLSRSDKKPALSADDIAFMRYLHRFRPHPGARSGQTSCTPSTPDAQSAARGCTATAFVDAETCESHACVTTLARETATLSLKFAKTDQGRGDLTNLRQRTKLAADTLGADTAFLPPMQMVRAGLLWGESKPWQAVFALLGAVPVLGKLVVDARPFGDSPDVARAGELAEEPSVRALLDNITDITMLTTSAGLYATANALSNLSQPLEAVHEALSYARHHTVPLRTALRAHKWEAGVTFIDDWRRHLTGRGPDICAHEDNDAVMWLSRGLLMFLQQFRVKWMHLRQTQVAVAALECMCVKLPYRRPARQHELRRCAQQIAATLYGVRPHGRVQAGAGARSHSFRSGVSSKHGALAGLGEPAFDVNLLDGKAVAHGARTRLQRPVVPPAVGAALIPPLGSGLEAERWARQAHVLAAMQDGDIAKAARVHLSAAEKERMAAAFEAYPSMESMTREVDIAWASPGGETMEEALERALQEPEGEGASSGLDAAKAMFGR